MRGRFASRYTRRLVIYSQRPLVRWLCLVIVAGVLVVYGAAGLWERYRATHNASPVPDPQATVVYSLDKPDETNVSPSASYTVPADQPRSINFPQVGASGIIQKVGLDQHNAVAVPVNVSVAGWYVLSAKPGEKGVSLIDGHVQGRFTQGIFKQLEKAQKGQQFTVTFGDNSERQFEVVRTASYSTAEAAKQMLLPVGDIEAQLNLITCGGTYNKTTKQYDKRVLVVSKRIK